MLLTPDIVPGLIATGASARIDADVKPRFKVGDKVQIRNLQPTGHTRLPGYIRLKVGTVERDYGVFAFPDTHAHSQGEKPQHCYSIRFSAQDLWGQQASANDSLRVDVFDDYMDNA